ncbi:MAG: SGNH/GDSL hydrolase family protein [Victivallaceae bacterium]|nr:SGNH/GDSL hydrolase family protein [Victivallaceae bacterium]
MQEKDFSTLDANYKSRTIGGNKLNFFDGFASPFVLEGFPYLDAEGRRSRLPLDVAGQCEMPGVVPMSMQGAGEILRIRTDSRHVGIRASFSEVFSGINRGGSAGFDLYANCGRSAVFLGNRVIPPGQETMEALWENPSAQRGVFQEYQLYFPYHSATSELAVGIDPEARLASPRPKRIDKTVLFYGSSITNCGAAARPGMVYPSIIARHLDFTLHNMGFSGSCLGEMCMADAIAQANPAILVMEFYYNAPDAQSLALRHEPFFLRFRARRKSTPVIMMSKCNFNNSEEDLLRRDVVAATWRNARANGDSFVDFIDGADLFAGADRTDCTQDGCHPNDLGASKMAQVIEDRLLRFL